MSCNLLTDNIVNYCAPVTGLVAKIWVYPYATTRVFMATNVVHIMGSSAQLNPAVYEAFKSAFNVGADEVQYDVADNQYTHYVSGVMNLVASSEIDKLDGVIVVALTNEGQYQVYGAKHGLWKSSQVKRSNDNLSLVTFEFTSREDMGEPYSVYVLEPTGETGVTGLTAQMLLNYSYQEFLFNVYDVDVSSPTGDVFWFWTAAFGWETVTTATSISAGTPFYLIWNQATGINVDVV